MNAIELNGVSKWFGTTRVLDSVELAVPEASITAVLGASGSGKTTLLRLIAGLERVDTGHIVIDGRVVDDGNEAVGAQHRNVGYVPQDGALFPHLTVSANIAFGVPREQRPGLSGLIDLVGLGELAGRYPHQLSGGQQQRVALARALAVRPSVVLLDEPFSSLDAALRTDLRRDVARVLASTRTTAVLVTHDQDEALAVAQHIAVLQDGRVVASDDPHTLYRDPPDLVAAMSLGDANILFADVHGRRARCVLGVVELDPLRMGSVAGPSNLLLRPEQLVLHSAPVAGSTAAVVADIHFHGHDTVVDLVVERPHRQELVARVPGASQLVAAQQVWISVLGTGRAWSLDTSSLSSNEALWVPPDRVEGGHGDAPRRSAAHVSSRVEVRERPPPRSGRPHRTHRSARRRRRAAALVVLGGIALGLFMILRLATGGSSASATGPVVFHVDVETSGRVRLSDEFVDKTTAKGVTSCARAAEGGDRPSVAAHTWAVPTAPFSNTVEIEVGTIARGYHGPGRYSQSVLQLGNGVLGIGEEDYDLVSSYASSAMTVNADGSGVVRFRNAPGDDDHPTAGWHGGITGTISWTCSS